MDFCETSIGGADIDEWTFERLVQVHFNLTQIVDDFIKSTQKDK